jgi:hypothetical protein
MAVMTSLALDPTAGSPGRRVLFVNRMDVYRLPASRVVQQLTRLDRDPFTGPGVPQRDPQWCQDQVGDLGGGGMPAHDPLGEHVDDEGDVDEPAQVLQWVKSATERMLGASAVKSRSNRSLPGGRLWPGRSVVRAPLPRRTPFMPRSSSPHDPSSTRSSIAPSVIAGGVWVGRSVCQLKLEPELHGQPPRSLGKAL